LVYFFSGNLLPKIVESARDFIRFVSRFLRRYSLICPILSGVLVFLSFTSQSASLLAFFALMPIFYILTKSKNSKINNFLYVFVYSATLNLLLIPTIPNLFRGFLLNSFLLSLPFIAFKRKNNFADVVNFAWIYIFGEWLQETFNAYPIARIGVITGGLEHFSRSANLFGSLFLSFLVIIANGSFVYLLKGNSKFFADLTAFKRRLVPVCGVLVVLGCNFAYGYLNVPNDEVTSSNIVNKQQILQILPNFDEPCYPNIARKMIKKDANILYVDMKQSENVHYYQVKLNCIMRAIEFNRCVVLNLEENSGNLSNKVEIITTSGDFSEVGYRTNKRTIYSYLGDIIIFPASFVFILGLLRKKT
jgi:hypothetical protein